jgi:hypothetical protein
MIETVIERNLAPQTSTLAPQSDALLGNVPLPFRAIFYPYGFAAEIITNAQEVLDAASESWGHFHQRYTRPALQLHVVISEDSSLDCPPHPTVRAQRYILSIVADAHNQAVCDLKGGFASAWLSQSILNYRSYLRYHFVEAAVLALLSTSYVTAIHAACVSLHGQGMLLCGDSGAGKSSLAYACARAGWTYTSDDASYLLENANPPRVIGNSHQVRFRPSAKELFPELHGRDLTPRAEGKPSIEVPTSEFPNIITADETQVQSIIYLNRQPSAIAELVPLPKEIAMERFYQSLYPVEEIRERKLSALQPLLDLEIYELRYRDLHHAIDRLEQLARSKNIGPI